jgi:conjugal transfer/entry exclusion protein
MEPLMATDEDPPFKEWEQLNEKLKQVKAAHRRGKATKDDVRRIEEEYDRAADRIDKTSGS